MQPGSSSYVNSANTISAIQDVYEKIHKNDSNGNDTSHETRDPDDILHLLKSMRSRL